MNHSSPAHPPSGLPTHEPRPLTPSLSPNGGEGARRAGEGDSAWFMAPMRHFEVMEATHEPPREGTRPTTCRPGPPTRQSLIYDDRHSSKLHRWRVAEL